MLHISHGKRRRKAPNGLRLAGPRQVDADQLEQVVAQSAPQVAQLVGVQFHVDRADQAALRIDHGKGQKTVQHEELAGVQHGRLGRNGDHAAEHDVGDGGLRRAQQQGPRGNHALEAVFVVDHVEIDDPGRRRRLPQGHERLADGMVDAEPSQLRAHVTHDRVGQVRFGDGRGHFPRRAQLPPFWASICRMAGMNSTGTTTVV